MAVLVVDSGARMTKIVIAVVLVLLAVGCGVLVPRFGFMAGMGAFIFAVAGLGVLVGALRSPTGKGPCPTCATELRDVPFTTEAVSCASCGNYALAQAGALSTTPPDHVASDSVYELPLDPGAQPDFHGLCVACGAAASVARPREMRATTAKMPGVASLQKVWAIQLPLCAAHATVDSLGNPPGVTSFEGSLKIRSYRAWSAARAR